MIETELEHRATVIKAKAITNRLRADIISSGLDPQFVLFHLWAVIMTSLLELGCSKDLLINSVDYQDREHVAVPLLRAVQ